MNTKYLVIADTYTGSYGVRYTLFGIFNTEKEAIDFIINNPTIKIDEDFGYDIIFDFFEYYKPTITSKRDYARQYIKRFNGNPIHIGGYIE